MKILRSLARFLKNKYAITGTPVIIKNSKGEILLGKRDEKVVFYPLTWGLPGGIIEYGESIEEAIKREIKEELGIKIKIIRRSNNIYENFPHKECNFHIIDIPYYAEIIQGIPKPKDETLDVRWFKPSEINEMELAYSHKDLLKGEGLLELKIK